MEMEAVIFDVDGTIWDSAKEVAESWTEAFQNYPESKGRVLTAADLEPYMGLTMEAIGEGLLPGLEKERREEIMCYAMEYENIYLAKHPGRFFPDFVSTVKSLEKAGKKLSVGLYRSHAYCGRLGLWRRADFPRYRVLREYRKIQGGEHPSGYGKKRSEPGKDGLPRRYRIGPCFRKGMRDSLYFRFIRFWESGEL